MKYQISLIKSLKKRGENMTIITEINQEYEEFKKEILLLSKEEVFERAIDISLYMYIQDYIECTATEHELDILAKASCKKKIAEICTYMTELDIDEEIASIILEDIQ